MSNQNQKQNQKSKPNLKFKWINGTIIVISIIVLIVYIFVVDKPADILSAVLTVKPVWLLSAAMMMVVYWLLESGILHLVTKKLYSGQRFMNTLSTSMIGQFYNCITPFASGGQPMQAYSMVSYGVPLGIAGSSLLVKFIVYQFSLTLYSLAMLVIYWGFFSSKVSGLATLSILGFSINMAVMLGLIFIGFAKGTAKKITESVIRFLAKLHLVKQPDKKIEAAFQELEQFHGGFALIRHNIYTILNMFWLSVVQLTVFFLVPYFLCLAFGKSGVSPLQVIAAQAFVSMITAFVPLPGAAGGAEISFVTFFAIFMNGSDLNLSMLLWRILTFYCPIVVGAAFSFGFASGGNKIQKQCSSEPAA